MNVKSVMIVDDTPANLQLLSTVLNARGYAVSAFPRRRMALAAALRHPPDAILLDINMPEMNGYEVCQALKSDSRLKDIPVIFISALGDTEDKVKAFQHGGVDYITKPFQVAEIHARVETHLQLQDAQKVLRGFNEELKAQVARQVAEINKSQLAMIFALAKLSHTRDDDTGLHLERVQHLCRLLASAMARDPAWGEAISPDFITTIFHASPLHDLGKVGIRDAILLKPDRLTPEEYAIMKTHTTIGADTLASVHRQYPENEFIQMGIDIARHHHEKWDGTGYPAGLSGPDIPVSARIMALVDVYDALRARRPYKEPFSHEKARAIVLEGSGINFDPRIVSLFARIDGEFNETYGRLTDGTEGMGC